MESLKIQTAAAEFLKKYRLLFLMVAAGVLLLLIPSGEEARNPAPLQAAEAPERESVEERLAAMLSKMEGAGKTAVLLTEAKGEQIVYQTDESASAAENSTDRRTETVLVTGSDRNETGLIRHRIPPVYQGAVVLCQGADRAEVRLRIVEAVMSATGLTSDRITVLKMK